MEGKERRERILQMLTDSADPISGGKLAKETGVSRQVVVQDIALLRANGTEILSTNRGYCVRERVCERVFKVRHSDEDVQKELNAIVDLGGQVRDVFVYHKVYGVVRAELNIRSRMDVEHYMENIRSGMSSLLKNVTSGYHYHTIAAESEEVLEVILKRLQQMGFLASLQEYEPVDFWKQA